jgi:hypothetical protein
MTAPILKQIAELPALPQDRLKELWREYFGVEPPAYRKGFLIRGLAHRIQELTYGGLSPAHQARLDALIDEEAPRRGRGRRPAKQPPRSGQLLVGTRLVREWKGVAHEVTVIDGEFEYQGRRFRSLSAVARAIAGTRWNGWLFFAIPNPNKRGRGK